MVVVEGAFSIVPGSRTALEAAATLHSAWDVSHG
jgi:hypothetical protein